MLILLYLVAAVIGLATIAGRGMQQLADQPFHSFGLVILLLLMIPFRWSFEIALWEYSIGQIPIAFFLIGIFLVIERHKLCDFYLTDRKLLPSLLDGLGISLFLIIPFFGFLVYMRTGQVLWLSSDQIPIHLVAAIRIGLVEELAYRGLFLGYLRRISFSRVVANLLQTAYFGAAHLRYLESGDYLLLGFALAFGFLAGWMTLRRENLGGALLAHVVGNFVPLLLNNGHVPTL